MAPKKPAQKMSLGDFLQDTSLGNWADELEDMPVAPSVGSVAHFSQDSHFAAGRDNRDRYDNRQYGERRDMPFSRDSEGDSRTPRPVVPLPSQPPYTAHVGNLAFDLTESEIENYFEGCKVISVRIMKDRMDNRPKGFGYVEFADLDSLKKALTLADGQLAGRSVRISVAEPPKSGGFGGEESAQGEWRTGRVLPPLESRNNRMGDREPRGTRNFSGDAAGRPERRDMNLLSTESGMDKWERRGPLPPMETDRRQRTSNAPRSGSSTFGNASNRSPSQESPADTGEWRTARPQPPVTKTEGDTPPPTSPSLGSPALHRKKLTLLPRSEHPQEPVPSPSAPEEPKSKSNPFGAARPVDTDSALKKVEERLAKEKEHKDDIAASKPQHPPSSPTTPRHEKGRGNPKQLLRRTSATPTGPASGTAPSENDPVPAANAEAQEGAMSEGVEAAWRKTEAPAVQPTAASAAGEEEPGWETVPTRTKKVNGVGAKH